MKDVPLVVLIFGNVLEQFCQVTSFTRLNPTFNKYFCPYKAIFIRLMCMITINLNHQNKKS